MLNQSNSDYLIYRVLKLGGTPSGRKSALLECNFRVWEFHPVGNEYEMPGMWRTDDGHMFTLIETNSDGEPTVFKRGYSKRLMPPSCD